MQLFWQRNNSGSRSRTKTTNSSKTTATLLSKTSRSADDDYTKSRYVDDDVETSRYVDGETETSRYVDDETETSRYVDDETETSRYVNDKSKTSANIDETRVEDNDNRYVRKDYINDCQEQHVTNQRLHELVQILITQRDNLAAQNKNLRCEVYVMTQKFIELREKTSLIVDDNRQLRQEMIRVDEENARLHISIQHLEDEKEILLNSLNEHYYYREETEHGRIQLQQCNSELVNSNKHLEALRNELKDTLNQCEQLALQVDELRCELSSVNVANGELRAQLSEALSNAALFERELKKRKDIEEKYEKIQAEYVAGRTKNEELLRRTERLQNMLHDESMRRKQYHTRLQQKQGFIKVMVREKPMAADIFDGTQLLNANNSNCPRPFHFFDDDQIILKGDVGIHPMHCSAGYYTFNKVFTSDTATSNIYQELKQYVLDFQNGYNVCFLVYGPANSGKNYTTIGQEVDPGILACTLDDVCKYLHLVRSKHNSHVILHISSLVVCGDQVYDLLQGPNDYKPVRICDDGKEVRIMEVAEQPVDDIDFVLTVLGAAREKWMEHLQQQNSSTVKIYHSFVYLRLFEKAKETGRTRTSTLVICTISNSYDAPLVAQRNETAMNLPSNTAFNYEANKDVLVLERVIAALQHNQRNLPTKIPYRESKLTHLLKPYLNCQSKTRCVLTVHLTNRLATVYQDLNCLNFAQKSMLIGLGGPNNSGEKSILPRSFWMRAATNKNNRNVTLRQRNRMSKAPPRCVSQPNFLS